MAKYSHALHAPLSPLLFYAYTLWISADQRNTSIEVYTAPNISKQAHQMRFKCALYAPFSAASYSAYILRTSADQQNTGTPTMFTSPPPPLLSLTPTLWVFVAEKITKF